MLGEFFEKLLEGGVIAKGVVEGILEGVVEGLVELGGSFEPGEGGLGLVEGGVGF